jgi:hypothetical protein
VLYGQGGWATIHSKDEAITQQWKKRNENLTTTVLRFIDIALDRKLTNNELAQQLLYSAKMYRYGRQSRVFGIDYLCRFTALEGLTCGSATAKKHAMIKTRLEALFPQSAGVKADIEKLWLLRCEASHQGKAFHLYNVTGSPRLEREIGLLEYYFTAVLVFAVENVSAGTVDALWKTAGTYQLPSWASLERPAEMPRYAISRYTSRVGTLNGAGPLIDAIYVEKARQADNEQ